MASSLQHGLTCTEEKKKIVWEEKLSNEQRFLKIIMHMTDESSGEKCLYILYNLAGSVAKSSKTFKCPTHPLTHKHQKLTLQQSSIYYILETANVLSGRDIQTNKRSPSPWETTVMSTRYMYICMYVYMV